MSEFSDLPKKTKPPRKRSRPGRPPKNGKLSLAKQLGRSAAVAQRIRAELEGNNVLIKNPFPHDAPPFVPKQETSSLNLTGDDLIAIQLKKLDRLATPKFQKVDAPLPPQKKKNQKERT